MTLAEAKEIIVSVEPRLDEAAFVVAHTFPRDGRAVHLALTKRLRDKARKGRVWKSPAFLTALKNAEYGFDEYRARSRGGLDGIFLLDRSFRPPNEMMRKIFDRYLDRPGSGVAEVAAQLGVDPKELSAVRLVSHHLGLLGVLYRAQAADWLILVDYDDSK